MIREIVKEAMTLRKVKAKDLAEVVGIAPSTMSQFLNGRTRLGQEKLEIMLEYLKIKLIIEDK